MSDLTRRFDRELFRGEERTPALLETHAHDDGTYTLNVTGPFGTISKPAGNIFDALTQARDEFEPDGWRLAVHGARRDTYPRGGFNDGGHVELMIPEGEQPAGPNVLDGAWQSHIDHTRIYAKFRTLDPCPDPDLLGTVTEQTENHQRWLETRFPHLARRSDT